MKLDIAVIFDLDGTLIDSAPVVASVLNDMRRKSGMSALNVDFYRSWISHGAAELVSKSMEIDVHDCEKYIVEFRREYFKLVTPVDCLYDGVIETIQALAGMGVRLAICSNKPEHLCRKIVTETRIDEYIKVVIGGDSLSTSKPGKEPVEYALQKLCIDRSKAVLVGDSAVDQHSATAANIPFVFFSGGYDDGVDRKKASIVIDRIPQLLDVDYFHIFDHVNSTAIY